MIRVRDLPRTIEFFAVLGLVEIRRRDSEQGRFTLVFLATEPGARDVGHESAAACLAAGSPEV